MYYDGAIAYTNTSRRASIFIPRVFCNRGGRQDVVIVDSKSNQGNPVDRGLDSGSAGFRLPPSVSKD